MENLGFLYYKLGRKASEGVLVRDLELSEKQAKESLISLEQRLRVKGLEVA